jgi:hypothetical protein
MKRGIRLAWSKMTDGWHLILVARYTNKHASHTRFVESNTLEVINELI